MTCAALYTPSGMALLSMRDLEGKEYAGEFVQSQHLRSAFEIFPLGGKLNLSEYNLRRVRTYCHKVEMLWRSVQSMDVSMSSVWFRLMRESLQIAQVGEFAIFPWVLASPMAMSVGERLLAHVATKTVA